MKREHCVVGQKVRARNCFNHNGLIFERIGPIEEYNPDSEAVRIGGYWHSRRVCTRIVKKPKQERWTMEEIKEAVGRATFMSGLFDENLNANLLQIAKQRKGER